MRRALLTATKAGLPAVGEAFMGGYFAGVIDTTVGNIIAADASQTGLRYALIVAPKSLETSGTYKSATTASPAACRTRWDGLTATAAMAAAGSHGAASYCAGLTAPDTDASGWYLPAMDELEVIYRNLKSTTENNYTTAATGSTFPGGSQSQGYNPSSDPTPAVYTTSDPAQTAATLFKTGGGQSLGSVGSSDFYWTATEYASTSAWVQGQSGGNAGFQGASGKTTSRLVRPVRRLVL